MNAFRYKKKTDHTWCFGIAAFFLFYPGFYPQKARAEEARACLKDCNQDIDCEIRVADCLLQKKSVGLALEHIKPLAAEHPESGALKRLLAKAYLADDNLFWAQQTLQNALGQDPSDCENRSWLAWVQMKMGALDWAADTLKEEPGCPTSGADQARRRLLMRYLERLRSKDNDPQKQPAEMERFDVIYPEDEQLIAYLRKRDDPGWIQPFTLRLEMGSGLTTNALAGSPTDPSRSGPTSFLSKTDLSARYTHPLTRSFRPTLETVIRGLGLSSRRAADFSYLELVARPGVIIGSTQPRLQLSYGFETLYLNQQENNRLYEAHRIELELELGSLFAFGGAGRRSFNQYDRTRTEIDIGLAGSFLLLDLVNNTVALSTRTHLADYEWYDLMGASALWIGKIHLGAGFGLQLGAVLGFDHYPHSGKERWGKLDFGVREKRQEIFTRLSAGIWSNARNGARWGLGYDFSLRDSTADKETQNYDYTEHRILLRLRWNLDWDPFAPAQVQPDRHVRLDYGFDGGAGMDLGEENIRDMLRQEEMIQLNSCGCD